MAVRFTGTKNLFNGRFGNVYSSLLLFVNESKLIDDESKLIDDCIFIFCNCQSTCLTGMDTGIDAPRKAITSSSRTLYSEELALLIRPPHLIIQKLAPFLISTVDYFAQQVLLLICEYSAR